MPDELKACPFCEELAEALRECIEDYEGNLPYKMEYLVQKHRDFETVARHRKTLAKWNERAEV